jgi:hypothetical protein
MNSRRCAGADQVYVVLIRKQEERYQQIRPNPSREGSVTRPFVQINSQTSQDRKTQPHIIHDYLNMEILVEGHTINCGWPWITGVSISLYFNSASTDNLA